jgi:hypothetical protein
MSYGLIPDTSVPTSTGRSANTPFRDAGQRRRPGRLGRFLRKLGTLWMERSRPEGPVVRLSDED